VKVLVTGAAGMLGREVTTACHRRRHAVVALAHPALDVTNPAAVEHAIERYEPDAVVNCAGFTDVDSAEDDEASAMRVNDEGAALLAGAASRIGAKILYPSSDLVFDGDTRMAYVESDIPSPLSAYGRSKQAGETSVAVSNPRHFVVRSAWLYGLGGENFVETMLRLSGEQPEVLVPSDRVGCPTYARHLAAALSLVLEGEEYGIHHIVGTGMCSWYEFAQEIFDQAGVECRVMAASTEMLGHRAPRPAYSPLRTRRLDPVELPHWRRGLAAYLQARDRPGSGAEDVSRIGGPA
jgi:dTDP-4-dehydrorhamnose reductase